MLKFGSEPFLECSTKGDKRFSAFCASLRSYKNKSIEEIYQAAKIFEDGSTNLHWRDAKGRVPVNKKEVIKLYSELWDKYFQENPQLLKFIKEFNGFSDIFGSHKSLVCQAKEIYRIWTNKTI